MSLFGWDIIVSNRLPTGTFSDGTTQVSNAVANIFMNVADDNTKPIMGVWRRMPQVEGKMFALSSLNNVEGFALAA
jgi:hypothetical protein